MANSKIDDRKLKRMLDAGWTQKRCAEHFEVTPAAVSLRVKALNLNIVRNVSLEHANEVVEEKLDAMAELRKINEVVSTELDWLTAKMKSLADEDMLLPDIRFEFETQVLSHVSEVRQQIKLALDIAKTLYDVEQVRAFQEEVLLAIGEASPETRERIVRALQEKRAIRSASQLEVKVR